MRLKLILRPVDLHTVLQSKKMKRVGKSVSDICSARSLQRRSYSIRKQPDVCSNPYRSPQPQVVAVHYSDCSPDRLGVTASGTCHEGSLPEVCNIGALIC